MERKWCILVKSDMKTLQNTKILPDDGYFESEINPGNMLKNMLLHTCHTMYFGDHMKQLIP